MCPSAILHAHLQWHITVAYALWGSIGLTCTFMCHLVGERTQSELIIQY